MTTPTRITLTGFSGTGKSTVARIIAELLGFDAVDEDVVITEREGRSIGQIFDEDGEAAFREIEEAILAELLQRDRVIVSSGGGAMLLETTRRQIVENSLTVCLEATPETIAGRLSKEGGRPLLVAEDPLTRIRRLKDQRSALYTLCDFRITTDALSPQEVAAEVVHLYQTYGETTFNRPGRVAELTRTPSKLPPVLVAPKATTIVRTDSGDYPVYVGVGVLDRLGDITKRTTGARRAFLISDEAVMAQWGEIGGKTAVNHAGAKNIVGLFYQPRAVVADAATLKTLPRRALVEGMGEVIKHALIRDAELLTVLESRLEDLLALEPELTTQVLARNVQIKGAVVSEDERETGGVRELLNYGHTLGHAFEAAGGYEALLHGEAVAVGMIAAAEIGKRVGITPAPLVDRQRVLIERAGLPTKPPAGIDRDRIHAALALDKKIVAGGQRWVLLEDVGRPIVTADVPKEVVEAVLDDLLA